MRKAPPLKLRTERGPVLARPSASFAAVNDPCKRGARSFRSMAIQAAFAPKLYSKRSRTLRRAASEI